MVDYTMGYQSSSVFSGDGNIQNANFLRSVFRLIPRIEAALIWISIRRLKRQ